MRKADFAHKLIAARRHLAPEHGFRLPPRDLAAEGGCGVIGLASSEQVAARHMLQALMQMRNRGNGKGGGIAAVGLVAEEFGVSQETLDEDYLLAVAYLDTSVRPRVEEKYVNSVFEVHHKLDQPQMADFREIKGLEVKPPEVSLYFVRVKDKELANFRAEHNMEDLPQRAIEDEFVYQNSYRLNSDFYASTGEKQAFVLSHGRNLLVLKMVGYGDDVIRYYQIEDMHANVWIGHHRYPTKGRVWHPGGAHPFIGMNEALVHNGDFANHASIMEYLAQRNIYSLFLTDTEVSVQVFDLLHRTYGYPLEYVIEVLAPTTERDFTKLPVEKQRVYRMLQTTHMHASPDGPWFFLIAQSVRDKQDQPVYRLTGITDTSMLRPQVFAWQEGETADGSKVAIGLAASEKQGIDAALESLAAEDGRFWPIADRYWNARGGSHTDGGAFMFSVKVNGGGRGELVCTDKFGQEVWAPVSAPAYRPNGAVLPPGEFPKLRPNELFGWVVEQLSTWDYEEVVAFKDALVKAAKVERNYGEALETLTLLIDRRYSTGKLRRSSLLVIFNQGVNELVETIGESPGGEYVFISADGLPSERASEDVTVVLDGREYAPEGKDSLASQIKHLYASGYSKFMVTQAKGHRFIGNGLGPGTKDVRIDVYGSPGDYLGSGIDGLELQAHNNGQDQLAQIMKAGKLVVHGDVGQTFMYGAKGGEAYVLGNAAGRPLINAVGKPRVVINGTCLDYLAESFMAGDPLKGGGFVILNGIAFGEDGEVVELSEPYPGGNLFSLASGGAIYVRDPHGLVTADQLNGSELAVVTAADWDLIEPYLRENERLFGIPVARLLSVDGETRQPEAVYRKIGPRAVRVLQAEEAWVAKMNGKA